MIEGVFGHFIAHFLDHVSREQLWKIRLLLCKFIAPREEMRVSFSALLRSAEGDSYLLVRSLHRKEAFGPFGGVYKYHDPARSQLDDLEFRPQSGTAVDDMKNDLRGFLPRRRVLALTRWFDHAIGREHAGICLHRELIEELKEVRLATRHPVPKLIQFKHIRRVREGPVRAAGQTYTQYRIFDIYDVAEPDEEVSQFLRDLRSAAATHKDLMLATAREIVAGRSADGRMIGHHAGYLFGRKRTRPDEPMFVEPSRPFK
jgi:hypothetical protein